MHALQAHASVVLFAIMWGCTCIQVMQMLSLVGKQFCLEVHVPAVYKQSLQYSPRLHCATHSGCVLQIHYRNTLWHNVIRTPDWSAFLMVSIIPDSGYESDLRSYSDHIVLGKCDVITILLCTVWGIYSKYTHILSPPTSHKRWRPVPCFCILWVA